MENHFFVDSEHLSPEALAKKHRLETDPSSRKSHMEYLPGMERIESEVCANVLGQMNSFDYAKYTAKEVKAALCAPLDCQADMDQPVHGIRFPGILTEKYTASDHEQLDPYALLTKNMVLVVPKTVILKPGSWVKVGSEIYHVLIPHELDEWKNEYENQRKADC